MIKLALQGTQAGFDVMQTLAIGQLSERHCQILIPASEVSKSQVARRTHYCSAGRTLTPGRYMSSSA
jgi:hypothetical protein